MTDGVRRPTVHPAAFVHPAATVLGDVTLAARCSVWPGAVLRGDSDRIEVGEASNLQDGAVVHVDPGIPCRIGRRVTIGHRAVLHGCIIEDGALIGIGAVVLNGAVVGAGALVAAGAVVGEGMRVPPATLAAGVPARVKRPLTPEQAARVARGWAAYVSLAARHAAGEFAGPVGGPSSV